MTVEGRRIEHAVVLSVAGDVDMLSAPRLLPAVEQHVADGPCRLLVLDLLAVTFLDSSGLKALLDVRRLSERRDLPVRFAADGNRHVMRPLEITGLDSTLAVCRSVDEALRESGTPGA
jgi:anti-sigma B factor antagonist